MTNYLLVWETIFFFKIDLIKFQKKKILAQIMVETITKQKLNRMIASMAYDEDYDKILRKKGECPDKLRGAFFNKSNDETNLSEYTVIKMHPVFIDLMNQKISFRNIAII